MNVETWLPPSRKATWITATDIPRVSVIAGKKEAVVAEWRFGNKRVDPNHNGECHGLSYSDMARKTTDLPPGEPADLRGDEMVHRPRVPREQSRRRPHHRRVGFQHPTPPHMKALHHSECCSGGRATDAHWATIAAFKFLTLTATRNGEVRNAIWDEIDLTKAIWTIPPRHTKTEREHRVPLSTGALTVLDTAHQRSGGNGLVFLSPIGRPLSNATMSKLCKENNVGCVPHRMRSSFRDNQSFESKGGPRENQL